MDLVNAINSHRSHLHTILLHRNAHNVQQQAIIRQITL